MKPLSEVFELKDSVKQGQYRDTVLEITDLNQGKIDPHTFFDDNVITEGMRSLLKGVFERFDDPNKDGVYKLTQAMGGGKTHSLIAAGLLARYPEIRNQIIGDNYKPQMTQPARVVSFSGRNNPTYGLWGSIAEQMDRQHVFNHLFNPFTAPGQDDWVNLFKDAGPTLILLDELPGYLTYGAGVAVGKGNLAELTSRALETLFNASLKEELNQVCIVFSDLEAAYDQGSDMLQGLMRNLEKESQRTSKNITPVQQNTHEIYNILSKKLFKRKPDQDQVDAVANAYGEVIDHAKQQNLINEQGSKLAGQIKQTYPFHPAIRDLYARFKDNPGFMQTRGLIRFMRAVVHRMFDEQNGWSDQAYLIHPHDVDLNDPTIFSEINSINDSLKNALSHDIASDGKAISEEIDKENQTSLASDTAKLILMSSLADVQNAPKGLAQNDILVNLASPNNRDSLPQVTTRILDELRTSAWYLHHDNEGKLLFKNVANITSKISGYTKTYDNNQALQIIRGELEELFKPRQRHCYQELQVLPAVDQIQEQRDRVTLVVYLPSAEGGVHQDLVNKYEDMVYKNRLIFLTSDQPSMDSVYDNAKKIKASNAVIAEMEDEKVPTNDRQYQDAVDQRDTYQFRLKAALENIFTKLYYTKRDGLTETIVNLQFTRNNYDGEQQVVQALEDKRKFVQTLDPENYLRQVTKRLFQDQKELPWKDVLENAAMTPGWIFHHPQALEDLKNTLVQQDQWREEGKWILRGPFPKPATDVAVREIDRDKDNGTILLEVEPFRGDVVHYSYEGQATEQDPVLNEHRFYTKQLRLSFLCVDSTGDHEAGEVFDWTAPIEVRHDFRQQGDQFKVEAETHPPNIPIWYTTDGADPTEHGGKYEDGFLANPKSLIQLVAMQDGLASEAISFTLPESGAETTDIQPDTPLTLAKRSGNKLELNSTAECFAKVGALKRFKGSIGGPRVIARNGDGKELEISGSKLDFNPDEFENLLNYVKENLLPESELTVHIKNLYFDTGHDFIEFTKEADISYENTEIQQ